MSNWISINGVIGNSGARKVFMGFAQGRHLKSISFPDVLDENSNSGYQRRFVKSHSLDFKKYIKTDSVVKQLQINAKNTSHKHTFLRMTEVIKFKSPGEKNLIHHFKLTP